MTESVGPRSPYEVQDLYYDGLYNDQAFRFLKVQQDGTPGATPSGEEQDAGQPNVDQRDNPANRNAGAAQSPTVKQGGPNKNAAVSLAQAPAPKVVTVRKGETLTQIAAENHVSLAALLAANPQFDPKLLGRQGNKWFDAKGPKDKGRDPDLIRPGDQINLPATAQTAMPTGQLAPSVGQTLPEIRQQPSTDRPVGQRGETDGDPDSLTQNSAPRPISADVLRYTRRNAISPRQLRPHALDAVALQIAAGRARSAPERVPLNETRSANESPPTDPTVV